MKKTVLFLMLAVIIGQADYANAQDNSTVKVAVLEQVMKDVIKNTVYSLGTQMLNKYVSPGYNPTYIPSYNTVTTPAYTTPGAASTQTTTTTQTQGSSTTTGGDYIPGQGNPPEQMIPVS